MTERESSAANARLEEADRRLASDFRYAMRTAEELLAATAALPGDAIDAARARLDTALGEGRARLQQIEAGVHEQAHAVVDRSTRSIREHPLGAVALSAAIGLVVGILIGRR